jgi:hypothetical protein
MWKASWTPCRSSRPPFTTVLRAVSRAAMSLTTWGAVQCARTPVDCAAGPAGRRGEGPRAAAGSPGERLGGGAAVVALPSARGRGAGRPCGCVDGRGDGLCQTGRALCGGRAAGRWPPGPGGAWSSWGVYRVCLTAGRCPGGQTVMPAGGVGYRRGCHPAYAGHRPCRVDLAAQTAVGSGDGAGHRAGGAPAVHVSGGGWPLWPEPRRSGGPGRVFRRHDVRRDSCRHPRLAPDASDRGARLPRAGGSARAAWRGGPRQGGRPCVGLGSASAGLTLVAAPSLSRDQGADRG